MSYKNNTLRKYLDDLAAKLPAPGGGSAAALSAAMGASLLSMVLNFTLGKPKYAAYENELRQALEKTEKLRNEFLNLVDLDVAAYKSKNLRDALNVPFMTCRLCLEAAKLLPQLSKKTNPNLATDLAVAAVFFEAAFASACFNVRINLKVLGDNKLAKGMQKELDLKGRQIKKIRQKTEEEVGEIIRG